MRPPRRPRPSTTSGLARTRAAPTLSFGAKADDCLVNTNFDLIFRENAEGLKLAKNGLVAPPGYSAPPPHTGAGVLFVLRALRAP